ncbi:hypothetical protein Nepgr_025265 [Nepenthes gracilis]|uniref:Uncharacterized protein n=1 Tax=Nepenthes gracilis TaxID=150966 RepID=A0AAD3T643_NEPGR|nr:hypothetical protein Nepgr_025265 [Nepenthes gracilis]
MATSSEGDRSRDNIAPLDADPPFLVDRHITYRLRQHRCQMDNKLSHFLQGLESKCTCGLMLLKLGLT